MVEGQRERGGAAGRGGLRGEERAGGLLQLLDLIEGGVELRKRWSWVCVGDGAEAPCLESILIDYVLLARLSCSSTTPQVKSRRGRTLRFSHPRDSEACERI